MSKLKGLWKENNNLWKYRVKLAKSQGLFYLPGIQGIYKTYTLRTWEVNYDDLCQYITSLRWSL